MLQNTFPHLQSNPVRPTFLRQVKQRFFLALGFSSVSVGGSTETSDTDVCKLSAVRLVFAVEVLSSVEVTEAVLVPLLCPHSVSVGEMAAGKVTVVLSEYCARTHSPMLLSVEEAPGGLTCPLLFCL